MTADIQTLIEERPHLKDPFEFYRKWQDFKTDAVKLLANKNLSTTAKVSHGYTQDIHRNIFQSFVTVFDLTAESLEPLWEAIENGEIDFMHQPLAEVHDSLPPFADDELDRIIFLLSRPYFLSLHEASQLNGLHWDNGLCPLCSARPALATIADGPERILHCSWCGTVAPYKFVGCPNCGNEDASKLTTIVAENEPEFRISACEACKCYVKIIGSSVQEEMNSDLADLASLPLDIVAQEKEYVRKAPNPIGLKKML